MEEIGNILIEGTAKNPHVDFNPRVGELILSGRSIPENAARVYEPLLLWINQYVKSPRKTTNLRLNLEYYNTPTAIWLAKIVKTLSQINVEDYVLTIHIYIDIEDYDDMEADELKEIIGSLVDNIGEVKVSISMKTYGIDPGGKIIKESTILF
jgi:hypothetical protein